MDKLKVDETIQEVRTNLAFELEMAKDGGRKVVGSMCSYFPKEIVWATNAISVGLCGTTEEPIAAAEEVLPADQCPMVKATYGRSISGTCPIFPLADCIVGETTCDGRKKMYELLAREKPMHIMELPQKPEDKEALVHWTAEVRKLKRFIEEQLDVEITDENLRQAIREVNEERRLLVEIHQCRKENAVPVMGVDLVGLTTKFGYTVDREPYRDKLREL
jgi:benzoyl-CoA reductase/2-hydroxyglutaryl-CoA dehydratase subunit BcrC/BadD/HgdB